MSPHQVQVEDETLRHAVEEAHAKYLARNPKSAKAHKAAAEHLPGGNTRTVLYAQPFPMAIKSGSDNKLTSADDDTYIDFLGEFSAGIFGHSHPKIKEAISTAMESGWNFGGESLYEKELAKKVTARFAPGGMELVRFTNSGTEANTMAIGAATAWTGRKKVLVFSNGYHGGTFVFPMDLCMWQHHGRNGPPPLITMNLPHDFVVAPFNNVEETEAILAGLPKDSLAAILVEPVQGSAGCRPTSPEFLHFLRDSADRLGALLIIDEVMVSRLDASGATSTYGLKADLMSLGKWIGGGMTFGAFGGRRDIMVMFDPARGNKSLMHPGTYNNNVFTMTAGSVALDIFNAEKVAELNKRGDRLKEAVTEALCEAGIYPREHAEHLQDVLEVDSFEGATRLYAGKGKTLPLPRVFMASRGSMLNLRFSGPDAALLHNLYYHFMLERGIYMASRGYTPLNLVITDENVDLFIDAVKAFLATYASLLGSEE